MAPSYIPPTRSEMNRGFMPRGVPPTLKQIKEGARLEHKPYTIHESRIMKKYMTRDLKEARFLEKEDSKKEKASKLLLGY